MILLLLTTGCSSNTSNASYSMNFKNKIESTKNRDKLPIADSNNGVSLGLYNWDGKINKDIKINLAENEEFKKFIQFHLVKTSLEKLPIMLTKPEF